MTTGVGFFLVHGEDEASNFFILILFLFLSYFFFFYFLLPVVCLCARSSTSSRWREKVNRSPVRGRRRRSSEINRLLKPAIKEFDWISTSSLCVCVCNMFVRRRNRRGGGVSRGERTRSAEESMRTIKHSTQTQIHTQKGEKWCGYRTKGIRYYIWWRAPTAWMDGWMDGSWMDMDQERTRVNFVG